MTEVMEKIEPLVIQGRVFVPVEKTTFEQDMYIMSRMRKAKIDSLLQTTGIDPTSLSKVGESILIAAYETGMLFELIGALYNEKGKKWTPEGAKERAEFFAGLDDQEDKAKTTNTIATIIISFFVSAERLSEISKSYSPESETPPSEPSEAEPSISDPPKNETGITDVQKDDQTPSENGEL